MYRSAVKRLAMRSGYTGLRRRRFGFDRVAILMFHGFTATDIGGFAGRYSNHLEVERFSKLLGHLDRFYQVIRLSDLLLPPRDFDKPPVVLTFDDGYRSNYELAFPLLKHFRMPATIFLATNFVSEGQYLWTDRVEYAIRGCKLGDSMDIQQRIERVKKDLKTRPIAEIMLMVSELERTCGFNLHAGVAPEFEPLTWELCRLMKKGGLIDFGNHTQNHPILSNCSVGTIASELELARDIILRELSDHSAFVCWPNGKKADYNEQCSMIAKSLGYKGAITTEPGMNILDSCNVMHLKRLSVDNSVTVADLEWALTQ